MGKPSVSERLSVMRKHIMMMVEQKGEKIGLLEGRKIAALYLKGLRDAARLRSLCSRMERVDDLDRLIEFAAQTEPNEEVALISPDGTW
mgnify:CR=1 FL=1